MFFLFVYSIADALAEFGAGGAEFLGIRERFGGVEARLGEMEVTKAATQAAVARDGSWNRKQSTDSLLSVTFGFSTPVEKDGKFISVHIQNLSLSLNVRLRVMATSWHSISAGMNLSLPRLTVTTRTRELATAPLNGTQTSKDTTTWISYSWLSFTTTIFTSKKVIILEQ